MWQLFEELNEKGNCMNCYDQSISWWGFLVRLPEEMPETLAGLPVTYPGGEAVYFTDAPLAVEVRSAEEFDRYVHVEDSGFYNMMNSLLTNWPPQYRTPEYAIVKVDGGYMAWREAAGGETQALLDLLESPESPMKLIGAVYLTARVYGQCFGINVTMVSDDPDIWNDVRAEYGLVYPLEEAAYASSRSRYHFGCSVEYPAAGEEWTAYIDGLYELKDKLLADPRVSEAEVEWGIPVGGPGDGTLSIMPVYDFGTGDFNEDGSANIGDAVLLARYLAEDAELKAPTETGKNLADMDGDGTLDSADLAALLEQLARIR